MGPHWRRCALVAFAAPCRFRLCKPPFRGSTMSLAAFDRAAEGRLLAFAAKSGGPMIARRQSVSGAQ